MQLEEFGDVRTEHRNGVALADPHRDKTGCHATNTRRHFRPAALQITVNHGRAGPVQRFRPVQERYR